MPPTSVSAAARAIKSRFTGGLLQLLRRQSTLCCRRRHAARHHLRMARNATRLLRYPGFRCDFLRAAVGPDALPRPVGLPVIGADAKGIVVDIADRETAVLVGGRSGHVGVAAVLEMRAE